MENINTSVNGVLRHKSLYYLTGNFFRYGISCYIYNMSSQIYSLVAMVFELLSATVKTAVYQGKVIETRAVCK